MSAELPPAVWDERLAQLLDELARDSPRLAERVNTLADNPVFVLLARLRVREAMGLGASGQPLGDNAKMLRGALELARQAPLDDAAILDAVALIELLGEDEMEHFVSPPQRAAETEASAWTRTVRALAGAAVAVGVTAWLAFIFYRSFGSFQEAMLFVGVLTIWIAYEWLARPKILYSQAVEALARSKVASIPQSTRAANAFSKLAAVVFGTLIGLVTHLLQFSPYAALALGLMAYFATLLFSFPSIQGYRAWALKEIAENGGLFGRDEE